MRLLDRSFVYAACGVFALVFPANILAQNGQQTAVSDQQVLDSSAKPASATLPDSPGAVRIELENTGQQEGLSQSSPQSSPPSTGASPETAQSTEGQESKPQRPVGTAAAEAPAVSGITAAQPAGVAIAPARQRRVRTIVLKVGAILGAGAALGAMLALTAGTPSKPPGAR